MKRILLWAAVFAACARGQSSPDATEIVRRADENMRGKTSTSQMTMQVVRPSWTRSLSMKAWSKGRDYELVLITAPAKEQGQAFLKRTTEMWNWVPSIGRMIKVPPSMMSQSWMGSDYTNDDLLKESSIVKDYTHALDGIDTLDATPCNRIVLTPKAEAAVVWGKVVMWISVTGYIERKAEYFDEDGELVHTEVLSAVKKMGGRMIPTHMEILPADKPGNKTILDIEAATFDAPLSDDFFSQQNMKRIR